MSDRLSLALPIDVARQFDHTVTQTQIANNVFQGSPDDRDTLAGLIEDAEDEFRSQANAEMRLSRAGTPGDRTTFEQLTYEVPGHEAYKRRWSGVSGDYLNSEVAKNLDNERLLPFDTAENDAAYIYQGLSGQSGGSGQWEDVSDEQGDLWDVVDHRNGTVVIHPVEIDRAMLGGRNGLRRSRQRQFRMAISYRYGTLGGSRSYAGQTSLTASLSDTATGTAPVSDASRLPTTGGGSVVLLVGEEYLRATVDASADELDIVERGVRGTTAAAHSSDDHVQYTPGAVRKAVAARAGMGLIQAGRYSAYLPDTDDTVDKSEMLDEMGRTWTRTIEAMQ